MGETQAAGGKREPLDRTVRSDLCFARTELGDHQVRRNRTMLPIHIARLLLLFESPQTIEDLRQMIDEPWLPEALIELERRRLIRRVPRQLAAPWNAPDTAIRPEDTGDAELDERRHQTRLMFLEQLGTLGTDMARRIDQCRSDQELEELMPQVNSLIEAIAGHEALGQFRQQTARHN